MLYSEENYRKPVDNELKEILSTREKELHDRLAKNEKLIADLLKRGILLFVVYGIYILLILMMLYSEENFRPRQKSGYDYDESAARGILLYLLFMVYIYIANFDDVVFRGELQKASEVRLRL